MAPPALLDGRRPPSCSYGCRGCCYGCRGPPELNKWEAGYTAGRCSTVPCRPLRPRHLPRPLLLLLRPRPALRRGASTRGRAEGSWTGCCQRRVLSTNVRSTQSSERGSSRDFLPDTRFTGERGQHLCVCGRGEDREGV